MNFIDVKKMPLRESNIGWTLDPINTVTKTAAVLTGILFIFALV